MRLLFLETELNSDNNIRMQWKIHSIIKREIEASIQIIFTNSYTYSIDKCVWRVDDTKS